MSFSVGGWGMRTCVVVIDDEPEVLSLLQEMLEDKGFGVVVAGHPGIAEQLAANLPPDLFLIDLMLPDITGIELARRLRAGGFATTPIIAMSASKAMTAHASGHQASLTMPSTSPLRSTRWLRA